MSENDLPADEPAADSPAIDALRTLRLLFGAVKRHSAWVEERCGVGGAMLWAMGELAGSPGMRVSDLARRLSIHPTTASNLLDKLEQRGYVERRRESADQRVVRLSLTRAGRAVVAKAPAPAKNVLLAALEELAPDELAQLNRSLLALEARVQVKDAGAAMKPLYDL